MTVWNTAELISWPVINITEGKHVSHDGMWRKKTQRKLFLRFSDKVTADRQ